MALFRCTPMTRARAFTASCAGRRSPSISFKACVGRSRGSLAGEPGVDHRRISCDRGHHPNRVRRDSHGAPGSSPRRSRSSSNRRTRRRWTCSAVPSSSRSRNSAPLPAHDSYAADIIKLPPCLSRRRPRLGGMDDSMTSTTFEITGYRTVENDRPRSRHYRSLALDRRHIGRPSRPWSAATSPSTPNYARRPVRMLIC